jgi:hypothetical protein
LADHRKQRGTIDKTAMITDCQPGIRRSFDGDGRRTAAAITHYLAFK